MRYTLLAAAALALALPACSDQRGGTPAGASTASSSSGNSGAGRANNPSVIRPGEMPPGAPGTTPLLEPPGGQEQRR
jgi:hypothetical protein